MEQQVNTLAGLTNRPPLIVTRHKALADYIKERGLVPANTEVLAHATIEDVLHRDVYGILSFSLASYCRTFTYFPVANKNFEGKELTLEEMRKLAMNPVQYKVQAKVLPLTKTGQVHTSTGFLPAGLEPLTFFLVCGTICAFDPKNLPMGVSVVENWTMDIPVDRADFRIKEYCLRLGLPKGVEAITLVPNPYLHGALSARFGRALGSWEDCAGILGVSIESLKRAWADHCATAAALNSSSGA